jgi:hypothetical protein
MHGPAPDEVSVHVPHIKAAEPFYDSIKAR